MIWSLAEATGWTPDYIRWDLSIADCRRFEHARLWLGGNRCRRASVRVVGGAIARLRERFDKYASKYGRRHSN